MKYLLIVFFYLSGLTFLKAQYNIESKLIGTWSVTDVISNLEEFEGLDEEEIEEAQSAISAFKDCQFIFGPNNIFEFNIDFELFDKREFKWSYNKKEDRIIIEDVPEESSELYIEIKYFYQNEELYIEILDTPFKLKLKKEKKI